MRQSKELYGIHMTYRWCFYHYKGLHHCYEHVPTSPDCEAHRNIYGVSWEQIWQPLHWDGNTGEGKGNAKEGRVELRERSYRRVVERKEGNGREGSGEEGG